jgi:hypothetical protein
MVSWLVGIRLPLYLSGGHFGYLPGNKQQTLPVINGPGNMEIIIAAGHNKV